MSEVFKSRVDIQPIIEPTPTHTPTADETVGAPDPDIKSLKDTGAETDLEIWEGENKRKYGHDIFNIREIAHTFPIKAEFGLIDKFIKSEMTERSLAMTTDNYQSILNEIESEIGTANLETYKRINRIFNYIKTLQKYREIKKKKEAYKLMSF